MSQPVRFQPVQQSQFFPTLKKRVDAYFKDNNIERSADAHMYFKLVVYVGGIALFWSLMTFGSFSKPVTMLWFALTGFWAAFNGLNVCHDAIHGSLFKNKKLNKMGGVLFNLVGANDYLWTIMHNNMHHTYTNVDGLDEDIESAPILRMSPTQKWKKMMRYQQYYAFLLYGLATISWVFIKDYKKFSQEKIGAFEKKNHPKKELYRLIGYKLVYYFLFIALPLYFTDYSVGFFIGCFVVMHLCEGYTLALIFMLAHEVDGLDFPVPNDKRVIENEWATHQMRTTANFSRGSKLMCFFAGGLNFQIEHHIFPRICHTHYPELAKITKATAEEFGIPYVESESFAGALKSHYDWLKKLGAGPDVDMSDMWKPEHAKA